MLSEIHFQGLGFNLSKKLLFATDSTHLSMLKWTDRDSKACGRNLTDLSFGEPPIPNEVWAAEAAAIMYGDISHPTIVDIVLMILDTWDKAQINHPEATWPELRFWKVDMSGAYKWLDFLPADVHCMAQEMSNDRNF